jgi:predicted amidohydrolase
MRVAAIQSDIVWEDPEANFERLRPWVTAAAAAGARLVVLPEMFACGFSMATERVRETPDGPSARFLAEQANQHGLWICGSIPESAAGEARPYNTLVLASPGGQVLHRYRKIHPFSFAGEHEHYGAGDLHVTVDIEGLRCTLFVCYDLRFADEFWARAHDTDAYIVVANWPERRRRHWTTLLQARAIENQAYVVGCNRVGTAGDGTEHVGDSRIVSPMGELLATAAGIETVLLADVDAGEVAATRDRFRFLADRRG